MKLLVDPTKKLFRWGPIKIKPLYVSYWTENIWREAINYYPWVWPPHIFIFDHEQGVFILEDKKFKAVGEKFFKRYLLNKKNYDHQWGRYEKWIKEYDKFANKCGGLSWSKMSNVELSKLYKEFRQLNRTFWIIVHVPEIANYGGEKMLYRKLEAIDPVHADEYLEILSAPIKYSFFQEEELELLRLAKKTSKHDLKPALKEHSIRYVWLFNSYGGNRVLGTKYFKNKMQELLRKKTVDQVMKEIRSKAYKAKARKLKLIRRLKLNKDTVWMAEQLSQSIYWQDHRKAYIWRMQHIGDKILRAVAKHRGWQFKDLLLCLSKEVQRIIDGRAVDRRKIKNRQNDFVFLCGKDLNEEYYGSAARKLRQLYTVASTVSGNELKGLVVSRRKDRPRVRGIVKIIKNPFKDGKKMKKGNILVAAMTSPEFVILMKKAAAIVTDHGSMISHAAIVSRELCTPCIVGTKYATNIFKDGDRVEIDTQKGIVRKIR